MRITNNMVTESILSEIQQLDSQQSSLQSEVSSGLAVTQPSDDPSAFGQVVELESQSRQLSQYNDNATQALNVATESYTGLNSLVQIYDRASQLGTLGTDPAQGTDTSDYGTELQQLIQQAVQVANSQFNGNYLYGGTAVTQPPFVANTDANGNVTSVSYVGNSQQAQIQLSATGSVAPSTSGSTNSGIAQFINDLVSLNGALQSGDTDGINAAMQSLQGDENTLTSAVAENGAVQLRIQSEQTQEQSSSTEVNNLISSDADANLPTTITQLNQAQLSYQAALQTAASVMHLSILDFISLAE